MATTEIYTKPWTVISTGQLLADADLLELSARKTKRT
jgi:hypothetical protein